ncbi:MAG: HEAT repeat domain-containing protein [Polyangiaceae bacterium]|nr:HEAT repeat domain-containing protein [Polyangiaceae bacterium]
MPSRDFQRFVETFFGTGAEAAREGPDTAALERLQGSERDQAEQLLMARLGPDDSRAALGLGVLRSQAASDRVAQLMRRAEGTEREVSAEALINTSYARWLIASDPAALANIVRVLEVSPFDSIRVSAVNTLRRIRVPESEQALLRAVEHDESPIVRHNAAKALLGMHGQLPDPRKPPQVAIRIMFAVPHVRQEALRELRELLAQHPMQP